MLPLSDNEDLACFLVTKHSTWKGKYKRLFSFGSIGVTTYDPETLAVTNRWSYADIAFLRKYDKGSKFNLAVRKDKTRKIDSLVFSTELRGDLLTIAYSFSHLFIEKPLDQVQRFEGRKVHWSGTHLPVLLDVGHTSLLQLDTATGHTLASYHYKDIESLLDVSGNDKAFIVSVKPFGRMHMFICTNKGALKKKVEENSQLYLSIDINVPNKPISHQTFTQNKFGTYSGDEHTTSVNEFRVEKFSSARHGGSSSVPRLFCITESCIVERDPETYDIVTLRPLNSILSLVREPVDQRQYIIEYIDSHPRTYHGPNRDSILATLLEAVRSSGNRDVHVKMKATNRGKRMGPYYINLEQEVEASLLKLLKNCTGKKMTSDVIDRFNCNVPYSGLLHSVTQDGLFKDNKERPIVEALLAITMRTKDVYTIDSLSDEELEGLFQAIRRLVASKVGFCAFTQVTGFRECLGQIVVKGLNRNNEALTHAAVDMICALMHPMHEDYDLKQEQLNKSSLLGNINFLNSLLDKWTYYVTNGTGALAVSSILDMLTFALCLPYSETTESRHFDVLLEMVANRAKTLFKHFQEPCITIMKGASLIMRAVIEEGEIGWSKLMQEMSLNECALPRHLVTSLFAKETDRNMLAQRHISRHLVGLFLTDNPDGMTLMQRTFPSGLLSYLNSTESPPVIIDNEPNVRDNLKLAQNHASKFQRESQIMNLERQYRLIEKHLEKAFTHWGTQLGLEKRQEKIKIAPVVLRKGRKRLKSTMNWPYFYYNFTLDHYLPNLIWNHKTRDELKNSLEKEIRMFESSCEVSKGATLAWNHSEFEVNYTSLKEQLCIDGYYIKVLLEKQTAPESLSSKSNNFFNNLYHRFLLPTSTEMKCMCLQAMALVYGCYYDNIGFFSDTKYVVSMLERTCDKLERDRLLIFLHKLTLKNENVKEIVYAGNGVPYLVDLMTIAHLHTSRAIIPSQSNLLEYGSESAREDEKEWHCSSGSDDSVGGKSQPVSFKTLKELYAAGKITSKTKCWAQGMLNWKPLHCIPQLKWCLLSKENGILNESEMTILILNMFINMLSYYPSRNKDNAIISPMSRIKTLLSSPSCLQHIVQLLLTFDPVIVEKVAVLLCNIAEDNPITSQFYLTGVFYFILMYNGSNLLPIAKFLKITHTLQAFSRDESASSLMQRSILGQLLPEAMVYYLENHGAEKFAQIFLGEYDTPEAIWNSQMRCMLIQKIAAHIADFTPRLWSNNKAQYQYIVIPAVRYPQLQNELFCNIYYLRHLCDTARFPNWPIADPIGLLRDVLEAWKAEVDIKPPAMSVDEAYSVLELETGRTHDEPTIRKAYYRLAQLHHPDKNPDGRSKFEAVNKAYDFLCSRSSWLGNSVNTNNIILILQTQSILFHRYSNELNPYKYAGYRQLTKTIQIETEDEQLFRKQTLLLSAAIELVYHTIKCSFLNAEEFNRENGFQVISAAFSRCVSVLSESTKDSDTLAQICLHCSKVFTIAAQFPDCCLTFLNLPNLIPDLVQILHFKGLVALRCAVVECITSLAIDPQLQLHFLNAGVLWYIISFCFCYDFTLEESGIESKQENNQEIFNQLGKLSIRACAQFAGYLDGNFDSPHNDRVRRVLDVLLTPYLSSMLSNENPHQLLKTLTSNSSTPYLVWDNSSRSELLEWLANRRSKSCIHLPFDKVLFSFSAHAKHLIIGGIFIKIYNEQPLFPIENPKQFVLDLLRYLDFHEIDMRTLTAENEENVLMALESLFNIVSNNQEVSLQIIGHFDYLFDIISSSTASVTIKKWTLSIVKVASQTQECIVDIASSGIVTSLFFALYDLPLHKMLVLDCIHALITSTSIVKQILSKGCVAYLLHTTMNNNAEEIRLRSMEAIARLMQDKVSGRRIVLIISRIFPPAIPDAILDSPKAALNLLATDHENPEIIWNEDDRVRVKRTLAKYTERQYLHQREDAEAIVEFPDIAARNPNEVIIGGVYLRLYNQNPGWPLRKPVLFLSDVMDSFLKFNEKFQDDLVDTVGTALINLLSFNPNLTEQLPPLGHLPNLFTQWNTSNKKLSNFTFHLLKHVFSNEFCVVSLTSVDCMGPVKQAMVAHRELLSIGAESLSRLFEFKYEPFVQQALDVNLIKFFLTMLEESEHDARTKALIVRTLKAMSVGTVYANTITSMLENSNIWAHYAEQNHDLFISTDPSVHYLTASTTVAGFLTEGQNQPMPSVPPPIDVEDT